MPAENNFFESAVGKNKFILQKNAEYEEQIVNQQTKKYVEHVNAKVEAEKKAKDAITKIQKYGTAEEIADAKAKYAAAIADREAAEAALEQRKGIIRRNASKAAEKYEQARFLSMSAAEKREYSKTINDKLAAEINLSKSIVAQGNARLAELRKIEDQGGKLTKKQLAEKAQIEFDVHKTEKSISLLEDQKNQAMKNMQSFSFAELLDNKALSEKLKLNIENQKKIKQEANLAKQSATIRLADLNNEWTTSKTLANLQKNLDNAKKNGTEAEIEAAQKAIQLARQNWEEQVNYKEAESELNRAVSEENRAVIKEGLLELSETAVKTALKANDALQDGITQKLSELYGNQAKMIARLQGSSVDWIDAVDEVSDKINISPMVQQTEVVKHMTQLVDEGIAYNLEMRAFLAEVSENIAATFDAHNSTLLRLIRIQQADTTAARLGMEASLTKLLNKMFSDTSYLTENVSEAITGAVMDASMTMTKNASLEFEYTLQKWLGALYSLGMSQEGVNTIATAINYLGSGNVTALNSNDSLQTLLAMSATKAGGKSYADMLTEGIDASDTNKLLKAMVELLSEISESENNMVTKSAYSEIFGLNITDLNTIATLSNSNIAALYASTENYSSLMQETDDQLDEVTKRLNITQAITNIMNNAMTGAAQLIGSNPVSYGTWTALKLLTDNVDEVKVPFVPNLDLINVAEVVMSGMTLVSTLISALSALDSDNDLKNLYQWDYKEYNSRGSSLQQFFNNIFKNFSLSGELAVSGSESDFEAVTMNQAVEQKQSFDTITSEEGEKEDPIYDTLDDGNETILEVAQNIRDLLSSGASMNAAPSTGTSDMPSTSGGGGGGGGSSASSTPGDSSNPYESAQGAANSGATNSNTNSSVSSTEVYELIQNSIISGNDTLISVMQSLVDSIDEKLGEQRVFYTSIVSESEPSKNVSDKVSSLSSQVSAGVTKPSEPFNTTVDFKDNNTHIDSTRGPGSHASALLQNEETRKLMETIIVTAVETAIRNIAGYSFGEGLPVVVTNLNNYGG